MSRAALLVGLGIVLAAGVPACSNDVSTPGFLAPGQQYWMFAVNARALTLSTVAPYDTFRLVATPRDGNDAPLAGAFRTTFTVTSGNDNITVDSTTGLVTALAPTVDRQARILVTVSDSHATHKDTVYVRVTPTGLVSPLAGLTLQLPPGVPSSLPSKDAFDAFPELAVFLGIGGVGLEVRATDAEGHPIVDPWVNFTSSNPLVASVDSTGRVRGLAQGTATITARTTLYGITRSDSLRLTFGPPQLGAFVIAVRTPVASHTPVPYFTVRAQTVARGAVMYWRNQSGFDLDITFDTPSAVLAVPDSLNLFRQFFGMNIGLQGGDIFALLASDPASPFKVGMEARYFPQAGKYVFRSRKYPILVDTLIVQ